MAVPAKFKFFQEVFWASGNSDLGKKKRCIGFPIPNLNLISSPPVAVVLTSETTGLLLKGVAWHSGPIVRSVAMLLWLRLGSGAPWNSAKTLRIHEGGRAIDGPRLDPRWTIHGLSTAPDCEMSKKAMNSLGCRGPQSLPPPHLPPFLL